MLTGEHLLTETATVTMRTPSGKDGHGNDILIESTRQVACWHVQSPQIGRDESGPIAVEAFDAFFPPGDPLRSTDKVTIGGIAFEVIGPPAGATNPRTLEPGLVHATLRRTSG